MVCIVSCQICAYHWETDGEGNVVEVWRGAISYNLCAQDALGDTAAHCDDNICYRCAFQTDSDNCWWPVHACGDRKYK